MRTVIGVFVMAILASCMDHVEKSQLPGRYVFTHWSKDTLNINSDGSYYHHTVSEGEHLENKGTWTLQHDGTEVAFANFSFLTDGMPKGYWYSRLRVQDGEIQLIYASDIDAYYKKLKP